MSEISSAFRQLRALMASQAGGSKFSSKFFDQFNGNLQGAALKATRHALSLPADLAFHRSMDQELAQDLDSFSARILSITNDLLAFVSTADSTQSTRAKEKLKLENQDDVVDSFQSLVVDTMDQLLERADMSLDDHLGRIKPPAITINPVKSSAVKQGGLDPVLRHASHLPKPQLLFKTKVDNQDNSPWRPNLAHKYNAQVPLGHNYSDADNINETTLHPYQYEIKHITYPDRMFQYSHPIPPNTFEETPFSWISTAAEFASMLDKLRSAKEIAVDLEHHSYRTWAGFLCLMQITTREEDFVVDTIALREELQELNEVFTDPRIVKIFHGAAGDICWLQQDFDLYIVNLFDTYHASQLLGFSRHGLANLLEAYCDFTADKRYQLADWRIRPLPEDMLLYARSDTHFLLYIYDNLRNALLDRAKTSPPESSSINRNPAHALVYEVLSRSEETTLRVYEKEIYDPEGGGPGGWDNLAKKWNKGMLMHGAPDSVEKEIYKRLHAWRDRVAREEDESRMYTLANNYLFLLAERPPADIAAFLAAFKSIPPVIRRRAPELLDIIQDTVKKYRDGANIAESDGLDVVAASEEVSSVPIDDVEVTTSASTNTLNSRLWSKAVTNAGKTQAEQRYSAATSTLFSNIPSMSIEPGTNPSSFKDVVSRIHHNLVIAPSVPQVHPALADPNVVSATTATADSTTDDQLARLTEQIEIPYVPATQRQRTNIVDDSIVVVGQARQKKRKRAKASSAPDVDPEVTMDAESSAETSQTRGLKQRKGRNKDTDTNPQEPFDYSVVPNILDDVPTPESEGNSRKKKRNRNNGGILEYGNFPAPPKAHRELKSGNQSYTFK